MRQLNAKNLEKIIEKDFRIAIFGSARIKKKMKAYENVFALAKMIGERGYDIITGGGPGIMEAANGGHSAGDKDGKANSIGLTIHLSSEEKPNDYVEMREQFERFAERLETFTKLSNVFVVTPGGIGTMLELFYTWQLVQVKKVAFKPIILSGEMWKPLIYWIIDYALKENLISSDDFDYIYITKNNKETIELIDTFQRQYKEKGKCWPIKLGKNK